MKAKRPTIERWAPVWGCVLVSLWILTPIIGLAILTLRSTEPANHDDPIYVSAVRVEGETSQPVELQIGWTEPVAVPAPQWSGVLQEVLVGGQDAIDNGTPVLRINGIIRVAAVTPWPFTVPLEVGDTGGDVEMLTQFLHALGYEVNGTTVFDDSTLEAVRRFASSIGIDAPDSVTSFEPSWVLFATRPGRVEVNDLVVGAPAPAAGTTVLTLAPSVLSASVAENVLRDGDILRVGGEKIELEQASSRVSPLGLQALQSIVTPGSASVPAELVRSASKNTWSVPAAAVVYDNGGACVYARDGATTTVLAVTVVFVSDGKAVIHAPLPSKAEIAVYPLTVAKKC